MKNLHAQKLATAILVMVFVTIEASGIQAQDLPTKSPFHLFSTSDAVDEAVVSSEVRERLSKVRNRRATAAARAVSITNFTDAVHAATIRFELDGRTITVDRDVQERVDEDKDSKLFWEGKSKSGDELGLLLRQGRLSGRVLTQGKDYKIQRLYPS